MRLRVFQGGSEEPKGAVLPAEEIFSIVELINSLIMEATKLHASDIHIAPGRAGVRVRMRVDGVLQDFLQLPLTSHGEIISRIKILTGLRTDEHQAPQDGRFRFQFPATDAYVDIRVSIVPAYYGEHAVLRLLADTAEQFTLTSLGFSATDVAKMTQALNRSHGMILSTGPTGSGKTTTLYTLLKMLNRKEVSIITIEDPVEYAIDGVEQIQVNPRSGLTFASGLRSILRQDPNIIMVGEIRDAETAGIAVNTALTGHLLLSTLHTNDAATTLPRLLDMGIDPYRVASTVAIAVGQRLVRTLCTVCKQGKEKGPGCAACAGSGYKGRTTINEVLVASDAVREAILRKASAAEIRTIAVKEGMTTMQEDGFRKALAGITTKEEVMRVIHE
jgi:type II secretory ATPase GspE/PulE/Tfp pilus assembly ATPase PilB-like protein